MIHIGSIHTLGQSLRAAHRQLGLPQAQLSLADGVGLRFIVELEAGKPTLRLEHVLRVIKALGGELSLSGLSSAPTDSIAARPLSDADQPAGHAEQHQALDENGLPRPKRSRWGTSRRTLRQSLCRCRPGQ
jgi:y4mF family transcriptional regulator